MESSESDRQDLRDALNQVYLAGLGALAQAEQEGSKLFQRLARRGETYAGPVARQLQAVRSELESRHAGSASAPTGDALAKALAAALRVLGVPTREEFEALKASIDKLSAALERPTPAPAAAAVSVAARPVPGGWFEICVGGLVVDRVRGGIAAAARVQEIQSQVAPPGPGEITVAPAGGGWYEVRLDGVARDKVQGRRAAEAAVERLRQSLSRAV